MKEKLSVSTHEAITEALIAEWQYLFAEDDVDVNFTPDEIVVLEKKLDDFIQLHHQKKDFLHYLEALAKTDKEFNSTLILLSVLLLIGMVTGSETFTGGSLASMAVITVYYYRQATQEKAYAHAALVDYLETILPDQTILGFDTLPWSERERLLIDSFIIFARKRWPLIF